MDEQARILKESMRVLNNKITEVLPMVELANPQQAKLIRKALIEVKKCDNVKELESICVNLTQILNN